MGRRWVVLAVLGGGLCAWPATASATVRFFHSPSGNIECQVSAHDRVGTAAYCQTFTPARSVTLGPGGKLKRCRGGKCLGNGPENATTLRYGHSVTVGPFRCTSRTRGMWCVLRSTRHGFELSRRGIRRV
jgi:hypothetical protein